MPNQKMSNKPDERECYLCGAKYRKKYLYRNGLSIKICNKCVENVNNGCVVAVGGNSDGD